MAQTNYTPISLYYSATASNVPTAANLVPGELAINTADGKLYYEDSAGVVQVLASKATSSGTFGAISATSITDSGNLTFTGTGNRITGDFSNATIASRVAFQSSTTNGNTGVFFIPNGTAVNANIQVVNNSDPTNASITQVVANSTESSLRASITGTGTYLPLTMYTNASERLRIDTSGNVGIGTSSPDHPLTVKKSFAADWVAKFTNESATGVSGFGFYNNSDTWKGYVGYDNSDVDFLKLFGATGVGIKFLTASTERMRIDSSGIVTMSAYGAGAATFSAAGVISSVSDETWKIKDGVPINTDAMLQKLEPGYWFYNEEKAPTFGEERQLGFYAQNVHEAIGEEAAPTPQEGKPWGYYDRSVLAVAVMSLKNALNTIEELKQRIETLESK
jgi:hypothetical protein